MPMMYVYHSDFPDAVPTVITDDMETPLLIKQAPRFVFDGRTVATHSSTLRFKGVDHGAIVRDEDVLETMASIVGFGVPITQI